jgi:hypothetical protein
MRTLIAGLAGTLALLLLAACVGEPEGSDDASAAMLAAAAAECRAAGGEPVPYGPRPWQVACGAEEAALYRAEEARIRAECDAAGLDTVIGGPSGWYCARATTDAGRTCRRESDCEGFCMAGSPSARTGQCSTHTVFQACLPILDDSGERIELCIE